MSLPRLDDVIDADRAPLVRPYAVAGGRTTPSVALYLATYVVATGVVPADLGPDHEDILRICQEPRAVVEVAAISGLPMAVAKILLSDLLLWHAIVARDPAYTGHDDQRPPIDLLEKVLNGLREL